MIRNIRKAPLGRLAAAAAVPILILLTVCLLPRGGEAEALYTVDDSAYVHVDAMSTRVFVTGGAEALVSRSGDQLRLLPGTEATVLYQGRTRGGMTQNETVDQFLTRVGIRPSPLEMASISAVDGGMEIVVAPEFIFYEQSTQVLPHETVYQENGKKPAGEETVLQEGQDGVHTEILEVVYQDGREISRQLIEATDTQPVPTIVERGTGAELSDSDEVIDITADGDGTGSLTLANGKVLRFRAVKEMTGYAYSSEEGSVGQFTAYGTPTHVGVVAVDPRVIPLGTRLYIVSNDSRYGTFVYGFATAEDTGVRGDTIDLYMDTIRECAAFGARSCTVYILE